MKKIFILCLAAIILVGCDYFSVNDEKVTKKSVAVMPCEEEVANLKSLLKAKDAEITELRVDTAKLNAEIRCMEQLADCGCGDAVVKVAPAKKQVAKTTYKKPASQTPIKTAERNIAPEASETRIVKNTGTPNLSHLYEGGKIIFCCPANGRVKDLNFPDYAMQQGFTFSNFRDNLVSGYNWDVQPSDGYKGDYGVTKEGTFYVSKALVQQALQKGGIEFQYLEIKCPYTKWLPKRMVEDGEYLIYRTQ